MMNVQAAIKLASKYVFEDVSRPNLRAVHVESGRVWATDGHRAIVLYVSAEPTERGDYVAGQKCECPGPPIDAVLPKGEVQTLLTLSSQVVDALSDLADMLGARTTAIAHFVDEQIMVKLSRNLKKSVQSSSVILPIRCDPTRMLNVNVSYLLAAIEDMNDFMLRQDRDPLGPIQIRGENGYILIMPCRI